MQSNAVVIDLRRYIDLTIKRLVPFGFVQLEFERFPHWISGQKI
jgi:hypothetical protein